MTGTKAAPHPRFVILDGLRGLAALVVAALHAQEYLGVEIVHHGYLMVDLFFAMSGFVLAAAYGDTLARGGMGRWFVRVRLLRLYPMALLGLALGLLFNLLVTRYAPGYRGPSSLWIPLADGLLFLPFLAGGPISPLNIPGWSLIFEIWINAAYGYFAPKLNSRLLTIVTALALLGLAAVVLTNGDLDVGARQRNILGGAARVLFSFPLGILIHHAWAAGALDRFRAPPGAAWLLASLLLAVALAGGSGLFELIVVVALFPAVIVTAVTTPAPRAAVPLFALAGRLSYPLYAIHGPLLLLCELAVAAVGPPTPLPLGQRAAVIAASIALAVGLAWACDRWIDAPLRAWFAAYGRRGFHPLAAAARMRGR